MSRLGLPAPALRAGAPADLCVFDREETWQVTPATLRGKSRNCAFLGETLTGRVRMTVVDGARRFARARGRPDVSRRGSRLRRPPGRHRLLRLWLRSPRAGYWARPFSTRA